MKKGLQKILLLISVITVITHGILPHHHHHEDYVAIEKHHDEEDQTGTTHSDDDHHGLFSFAQLDKDFLTAKTQNKTFELPVDFLPALVITFLSDRFST